jgi:hypothetical protein
LWQVSIPVADDRNQNAEENRFPENPQGYLRVPAVNLELELSDADSMKA